MKTLTQATTETEHSRDYKERLPEVITYIKENEQNLRRKYGNQIIGMYDAKSNILCAGLNSSGSELFDKYNKDKQLKDWIIIGTIDDILKLENKAKFGIGSMLGKGGKMWKPSYQGAEQQ